MSSSSGFISGVDFVGIPARDLAAAARVLRRDPRVAALGLHRGAPLRRVRDRQPDAEVNAERIGPGTTSTHPSRSTSTTSGRTRQELEERGVGFHGDTIDTGVCHMALFADPEGNALMLHHRYAARRTGRTSAGQALAARAPASACTSLARSGRMSRITARSSSRASVPSGNTSASISSIACSGGLFSNASASSRGGSSSTPSRSGRTADRRSVRPSVNSMIAASGGS